MNQIMNPIREKLKLINKIKSKFPPQETISTDSYSKPTKSDLLKLTEKYKKYLNKQ